MTSIQKLDALEIDRFYKFAHLFGIQKSMIWYTKRIELAVLRLYTYVRKLLLTVRNVYTKGFGKHKKKGAHNAITTLGSVSCFC